jgi:hypothetical protein
MFTFSCSLLILLRVFSVHTERGKALQIVCNFLSIEIVFSDLPLSTGPDLGQLEFKKFWHGIY